LRRADSDSLIVDQVVILIDDQDKLATIGQRIWQSWIGRDPEDVLVLDSPLFAHEESTMPSLRDVTVARGLWRLGRANLSSG